MEPLSGRTPTSARQWAMRVLNFHGIGKRTPASFAAKAMSHLKGRVPGLQHESCHWGPLLDVAQEAMLADMRRRGSRGNLVQGISYETLGDALAYRNVEGAARLLADYAVANMGGVDVVVAHSLGCVLAHGWLASRADLSRVTLVTMGTNLGLWMAGAEKAMEKPRCVSRWLNFFDATDGLGGPIAGFARARDIEVSIKGPWYSFLVPSSDHIGFWDDKDLFSRILPMHLGY